jgi:glycosyltransferase involved in cell wall biosynthesis
LVKALNRVLACRLDYSASIIGPGEDVAMRLVGRLPESIRSRVRVIGRMANRALLSYYQSAQIICVSSRNESFHIAAAEALCCGCSVAGPAALPSMHYFAGASSGSLAIRRTEGDLADAILAEIEAWKNGARDPGRISAYWRAQLLAARHVDTLLQFGAAPLKGRGDG